MKKLFLIILVIMCSKCTEDKNKINSSNIIYIDTVYQGQPNNPGYTEIIKYKLDTLVIEYHEKYFTERNRFDERHQYLDSNGVIRYNHGKIYDEDGYKIFYNWHNQYNHTIISIDSVFNFRNKLIEVDITIGKERQFDYDKLSFIINKKYYNNSMLKNCSILDFGRSIEFREQGNDYYEMETDVLIKYAEWESSSKRRFGRALTDAMNEFSLALLRIEKKYLETALIKHQMDLLKYNI